MIKKNIISIVFCIILLVPSCASPKLTTQKPPQQQEVVSGENDPLMKLLLSGLIILSVNFLFTK